MNNKKAGVVVACMALAITLGTGFVFAAPAPLTSGQPPFVENDGTLVPLRTVTKELGADVGWDSSTQTVTVVKGGIIITLKIGSNTLTRNGEQKTLDVPAQIVDGRVLVPIRVIAENLGIEVDWNENKGSNYNAPPHLFDFLGFIFKRGILPIIGWDTHHDFGIPATILGLVIIIFGKVFALWGLKSKSE